MMVRHKIAKPAVEQTKIGSMVLRSSGDLVEIQFGAFYPNWLILARRLEVRGFSVDVSLVKRRTLLMTSANIAQISAVSSRKLKRKLKSRWIVLIPTLLVAVVMATVSTPSAKPIGKPGPVQEVPCSKERIIAFLEGKELSENISIDHSVFLGGVRSGKLLCKSSKYSYTLDLGETKRVLKLVKLDS